MEAKAGRVVLPIFRSPICLSAPDNIAGRVAASRLSGRTTSARRITNAGLSYRVVSLAAHFNQFLNFKMSVRKTVVSCFC